MWKLYDELIDPIPQNIMVDEIIVGVHWTMVRVGENVGVAATNKIETVKAQESIPKSWKTVASLVKSWNMLEASIGMAAINAFYNNVNQVNTKIKKDSNAILLDSDDIFLLHADDLRNKKTAIIGHFKLNEQYVKNESQTYILERNPQIGDYPDSACEYILPEMECVFITGCTFVNKTLPRLLELSRQAKVILVGPSVPMAFSLFEHGVSEIGGTYFDQIEHAKTDILSARGKMMAKQGKPLCIKKREDV